jgi:hypothetical protein
VLDGELVLYDPATQRVHVLNATAAFAWNMCDGGHTADDIVATLASKYPESPRQIENDVVEILRRFWDEGLIGE